MYSRRFADGRSHSHTIPLMPQVIPHDPIRELHGKVKGNTNVHFFTTRTGKIFTRTREETYQANQSPRQKWNSAAFAYAHKQLHALESTPESLAQINADFEAANHIASNGKSYSTAHAWKFNSLLHEYKSTHPFEQA